MEQGVAVIGAGAAGLSAAWRLAAAGVAVTLYEAGERAGGALRTVLLDGARVDVGVQLVSSTHSALFDLVAATAGDVALQRAPGRDALWRRGRAHAITYGSVSSLTMSGALPTTLKLKLGAKYLPFLKGAARWLDANDPAASGGTAFDGESIGGWGGRELGEDFVELLAYPLLAAYYGAAPEEVSAAVYHALARVGLDVSVYAAARGFGALAHAVVTDVEARGGRFLPNTAVEALRVVDGGVELTTGEGSVRHAAAVCAVPANRALALAGADGPLAEWLRAVETRSTFTVALRIDREFPTDWFGLSFPRRERPGDRVAAVCVQSRKLHGLVPAGDALVVLPSPAASALLLARSDDEITESMLQALEAAAPGVSRRVTGTHVARFADGYTVFGPGHLRAIESFSESWLPPRIALAGDYRVAPSVEGAVRSGERAARRLLAAL